MKYFLGECKNENFDERRQPDGTVQEEEDILPLPNAEKVQELVQEDGTWCDDDKWDGI